MKFLIGEKEYELVFGMKFIRSMDKKYMIKRGGVEFGFGMNMGVTYLAQKNPTVLQNIIESALSHDKEAPTPDQVEVAIIDFAEKNNGLDKLFDDIEKELGNAPLTKATMNQHKKNMKAGQKAAAKEQEEAARE